MTERFEAAWEGWNELPAVAMSSWAGGALAALHFAGVQGETVLCPSNTFMATPLAAIRSGAEVQFVDCNREDLCMSFADFERAAEQHKPRAAFLVHIGGHIAFDSERIAEYCARARDLPDRGLRPRPRRQLERPQARARYGDAGVYSLYATKTISTGEGGVLVSRRPEVIEHARDFRNYGKPSYDVAGLNFRMSEFTAALGLVQIERMPEIVAWKNEVARAELDPQYAEPARAPDGDGLGSLQVHRVRLARALDRPRLRRAVPPDPGPRRRSAQYATGWRATIPAFRCITGRVAQD